MSPLRKLLDIARRRRKRIVLAEGEDPRIVEGGLRAVREGVADVTLLGDEAAVHERIGPERIGHADGDGAPVRVVSPERSSLRAEFVDAYATLRAHKGVDRAQAEAIMRDPLRFAAMMVRLGHADGTVSGAVSSTADVLRAALQIIGKAEAAPLVSSFFIMDLPSPTDAGHHAVVFADCALVVAPEAHELAAIATCSADSCHALMGTEARIAMLSFSTHGSASHERVDHVAEATARARAARPDLVIGGETQFDAAIVPEIAALKAPGSQLQGDANVFVFPNLEAGNIGYKIAQRIGGATAIGPILQGLAKPANDLSRGCSADDVFHMIAVTAVQASRV